MKPNYALVFLKMFRKTTDLIFSSLMTREGLDIVTHITKHYLHFSFFLDCNSSSLLFFTEKEKTKPCPKNI